MGKSPIVMFKTDPASRGEAKIAIQTRYDGRQKNRIRAAGINMMPRNVTDGWDSTFKEQIAEMTRSAN